MPKETVRLKKSKLSYIARRSGQPREQLEAMLELTEAQGRKISVTYEIVNNR